MTLNEFLTENIFELINDAGGLDFVPPENLGTMNSLLRFKHGSKPIDISVKNVTMQQLADMVVMLYKQLWVIESGLYDVVVEGSGGQVIKVTENNDRVSERLTAGGTIDKVTGFNSDDMIDDSGSEHSGDENLTETGNRLITTITNNPTEAFKLLESHVKNSIIGKIVDDVGSFLTLKIYR